MVKHYERRTDSVSSAAKRAAKMKAEAADRAKAEAEAEQRRLEREEQDNAKAREEEDAFVEKLSERAAPETREALLDRIREMREEKAPTYTPPPLTEGMKTQLEAEQEAGRQATAKAEA